MAKLSRFSAMRLSIAAVCVCLSIAVTEAQTSVRAVKVLGGKDTVEIEVEASDRIVPETQVLTGPDRLVVDFPNTVPGSQVRSQSVERGDVKDVRVGLFQSKPPITRVVLDLKSARSYQVFPYGRTVMIKVTGGLPASEFSADNPGYPSTVPRPGLVATKYVTRSEPVIPRNSMRPALEVTYQNGLLALHSNKSTLSEVLYAIQQRTGADIAIAAGAEQEKVVADIEPAPAPEVLARLLNGSRFNFLILSAPDDPRRLDRVILTARMEGPFMAPPPRVEEQPPVEDPTPMPDPNMISAPPVQPPPPKPEIEQPETPQQ